MKPKQHICLAIWQRCHTDMALGRSRQQVESSLVLDNFNKSTANRQAIDYEKWKRNPASIQPPQGWSEYLAESSPSTGKGT